MRAMVGRRLLSGVVIVSCSFYVEVSAAWVEVPGSGWLGVDTPGKGRAALLARERRHAQAARRREGENAGAVHPVWLRPLPKLRPTALLGHVRNDQGVLGLQDHSPGVILDRKRGRGLD